MPREVLTYYHQNAATVIQQIAKYEKLINTHSLLRLLVFVLMAAAVATGIALDSFTLIALSFLVLAFLFTVLVSRQSRFTIEKQYAQNYKAVNENELQSIEGLQNIYNNGSRYADDKHNYTADLDVFGSASLYQLLNRAATAAGMAKLAGWLGKPAARTEIQQRQKAVKELAGKSGWKLDVQARLLFALTQPQDELPQLFAFTKLPLFIKGEKWLAWYSKIIPYVIIVAIIAGFKYPAGRQIAIALALLNGALTFANSGITQKTDLIAGKIAGTLNHYADVFGIIEQQSWQAELLKSLAAKLKPANGHSVSLSVKRLGELINKLNVNANPIVSIFANGLLLWNIRQVIAIEHWKRSNQANLETAFDVLAEFEALLSLAGVAVNYPDWCFPVIAEGEAYTLTVESIAHPLIPAASRVENSYSLLNTHGIDLITSSNMAGKSTFLRTLGINTVLALCGAPVCARSMQVSVMQLLTYMRIKDSLNESTSTFKAELDRLQLLLKTVEQPGKVFFLIDEMLRGTNSVDKYLGSKAVIERLISRQGTGLVATHDLQLAELEKQYPYYVRNFYFDIQVIDNEMRFDYKLKPGECKTFNASLLLKQIGIEVAPPPVEK